MSERILPGRYRPGPCRGPLGFILPLSIVFILLPPPALLAEPPDDAARSPEVGGSREPREMDRPPVDLSAMGLELSLQAGYTAFSETDLSDTYGGVPQVGVEASFGTSEIARFMFGVRYGEASGDPFYDTPEFDGGGTARLRTLPITFGFKIHNAANPRYRLYWGVFVEWAWIQETMSATGGESPERTDQGWTKGLQFMVAPEWRSRDHRRAVGLTLLYGGSSGKIGTGRHDHEVNTIGGSVRLHYTLAL